MRLPIEAADCWRPLLSNIASTSLSGAASSASAVTWRCVFERCFVLTQARYGEALDAAPLSAPQRAVYFANRAAAALKLQQVLLCCPDLTRHTARGADTMPYGSQSRSVSICACLVEFLIAAAPHWEVHFTIHSHNPNHLHQCLCAAVEQCRGRLHGGHRHRRRLPEGLHAAGNGVRAVGRSGTRSDRPEEGAKAYTRRQSSDTGCCAAACTADANALVCSWPPENPAAHAGHSRTRARQGSQPPWRARTQCTQGGPPCSADISNSQRPGRGAGPRQRGGGGQGCKIGTGGAGAAREDERGDDRCGSGPSWT